MDGTSALVDGVLRSDRAPTRRANLQGATYMINGARTAVFLSVVGVAPLTAFESAPIAVAAETRTLDAGSGAVAAAGN
jgi:hypothetical protein